MAAFADGRVQAIKDGIDLQTYLHLITPNGKRFGKWAQAKGLDYIGDINNFDPDEVLDDKDYQ